MVVLQRRRSSATTLVNAVGVTLKSDAQVPLGYDSHPSNSRSSLIWTKDTVSSCNSSTRSDKPTFYPSRCQSEPIKYLFSVACLSWIAALYLISQSHSTLADMQHQVAIHRYTYVENKQSLKYLKEELAEEANYVENLQHTREALQHELRFLDELADTDYDLASPTPDNDELIDLWLEHRQDGLEQRVEQLQHYLQEFSRAEAIKRFGPGPHYVRFTVEFENPGGNTQRSFVAELAPLDDMPHSVYFFLETIAMKIWDHTAFVHEKQVKHVFAAIPIDFSSLQKKNHHLDVLGWKGLAFPEYSPRWKHEKYTIGFANMGPAFYLNTGDNSKFHGPGEQPHHVLVGDADPCFARVVEGKDVIDDLTELGHSYTETNVPKDRVWADYAHALTQVISIEIIEDYNVSH